jgi:hypothetical protein
MSSRDDMDHSQMMLTASDTAHSLDPMPKTPQPERVIMPISRDLLDRIEEFRWSVRAPSRAEAMRALIEEGLANPDNAAKHIERDARK